MEWHETIASKCRYGDIAKKIWEDWNILWEDSEDDYQGHATILAEGGGKYSFYEWWYGSCSGCDTWEAANMSDEDVEKEMRDTAIWFDSKEELKRWLDMLDGPTPISNLGTGGLIGSLDLLSGGIIDRINEVKKILGIL